MTTPHCNAQNQNLTTSLPDAVAMPEPSLQPISPVQTTQLITLPLDGYSRASQLLPFLPIGVSTLWKWAKTGQFPAPIKLSTTVTAWRNQDVHDWFNQQTQQAKPVTTLCTNDEASKGVA